MLAPTAILAPKQKPFTERRKAVTDADVLMHIVKFVGIAVIIQAIALSLSLLIGVITVAVTGKELGGLFTALVSAVTGTLGTSLGYIGGLLTNPFNGGRGVPTPQQFGEGLVDAAKKAEGLPVTEAQQTSETKDSEAGSDDRP